MAIRFNIQQADKPGMNVSTITNRRAAQRQTEAMRDKVFAKYQSLVGTIYKNSLAARRAASAELRDKDKHPEYWDEDAEPRKPLNLSSTCFAKAIPSAGGVFLFFRSNPEKAYFYPCAGTTAATAKRVENLLTADSIGRHYLNEWGAKNGARRMTNSKTGGVYYQFKGGKKSTPAQLRTFSDKMLKSSGNKVSVRL